MPAQVSFGSLLDFEAAFWYPDALHQPLPRYGTGLEVERVSRTSVSPGVIGDFSGGLITSPGIVNWQQTFNRFRYNQGIQTRYPGVAVLPYVLTNQGAVTNDADISGFNALGVRAHGIVCTAGGTRYLVGLGTKLYRADTTTGAMSVASINVDGAGSATAFGGNVTCVAQGPVGGTVSLLVALEGANDILYTTDVTASPIVFTTLKTTTSGDWIAAMQYLPTVGPGVWAIVGTLDGVEGVFWELGSTPAASWSPEQATLTDFLGQFPTSPVMFTAATSPGAGASDNEAGDVAWTSPGNIVSSNDTDATAALTDNQLTEWLVASAFSFSGPAATDQIVGVLVEIERSAPGSVMYDDQVQLRLSGVQVGEVKKVANLFPTTDTYKAFGALDDAWFADLTGADLTNLEIWYRVRAQGSQTTTVDHIRATLAYRPVPLTKVIKTDRQPFAVVQSDLAITPNVRWATPDNALQSDGLNATFSSGGADQTSDYLIIGPFFAAGELSANMQVQGIQLDIERTKGSGASSEDLVVQLYFGGSLVGLNQATLGTTWNNSVDSGTELTISYGRDGSTWGVNGVSGDDMTALYVAIRVLADGGTTSIDAVTMHISGIVPGQSIGFDGGDLGGIGSSGAGSVVNGWMVARNPVTPNRVTICTAGELWFINCAWDPDSAAMHFDFTQPNEGVPYVHHAAPYLGGYLIAGNQTIDVGRAVKFVSSNGDVLDFAFPAYHGAKEVRVNSLMVQGAWAILDVINSDNTDRQWWFYNDKKYYPDTILQSLSENEAGSGRSSIAATPIAWSTQPIYGSLNMIYSVFPNSTDTAWARQFLPPDLGSDPRITNTTQVRSMAFDASGVENTALYIETPNWDVGPQEANKTLLTLQYLDRLVSADASTYGTVVVAIATDGGTSFTMLNTFDSAFKKHLLATAGTAYRSLVFRLSLTHAAGTVKSPSALPFVFETDQQWPMLRHWKFIVDPATLSPNFHAFLLAAKSLADTKAPQTLKVSTIRDNTNTVTLGAVATMDPLIEWSSPVKLPQLGRPPVASDFVDARGNPVMITLNFTEKPGTIS